MLGKSLPERILFACVLTLFVTSIPPHLLAQKSHKELRFPKLHEPKIPEAARFALPNGMILYLLEDHELPLINMVAYIKTGGRWEPADKAGLAGITGAVLRTGGTTLRTGEELDDELEGMGASVETAIDLSRGFAQMSALKEDTDRALAMFADVLLNPAFRQEKIDLAKIRARDAIARRNDNVDAIARREFAKIIYGPSSPYARHTEYKTIDNINRNDIVAFYKRFFVPNHTILGVWGDFDPQEIKRKIEQAFKSWKRSDAPLPPASEVKTNPEKKVYLVKKEDVNQTAIRMGHLGGLMSDPEYPTLSVLGEILGGGFSARLFREIRTQKGLAYSAYGNWGAHYDYPGVFTLFGQTKSGTTVKAIRGFLDEAEKITKSEVTTQELQFAKESILNSFVFNFDSKRKILERIIIYEYHGYPKDFLLKYKEKVEKVSKPDILSVGKKRIHPEKITILAVGREQDFDQPLSVFGPVQTIDITIPKGK